MSLHTSNTILKVSGLQKKFGSFEAVRDVSFQVNKGDVFGFLGPNGAGKSTTIRCMLSLIQYDAGEVSIFGESLAQNRNQILSKIGCIIEKPDFYKYLSAQKNLELVARISGARVSKKQIQEMLDFVGLGDRSKDKVGSFSHGMKQRLGIAQTLLHNPELIVLDEPTTGLDPQGIKEVRELILRLKNEQQKTILLSSHQLAEIEMIANRMIIINKGKTIVEGSVAELLQNDDLIVLFTVSEPSKSKALINREFPSINVELLAENQLKCVVNEKDVPQINACLTQNGVSVHAIEPKRKLEDYFMKIVSN